jgi:hypothetical protein
MQKLKLQNAWNVQTKSFDKNNFNLKESDKSFTGMIVISTKVDEKWLNKSFPFIAFKSKIDHDTIFALRNSNGKTFEAEISLMLYENKDGKADLKIVINKGVFEMTKIDQHNIDKSNGYAKEQEEIIDDEILF